MDNNILSNCKIFSGSISFQLTESILQILAQPRGKIELGAFSDGETRVEINEAVRGQTVFLIQSTCTPVNDNIMELLIMADACFRSSAQRIVAVVPYYGYSRQDRRPGFTRTSITSSLVAKMIKSAGISQLITVDLHSEQQQGFFQIPVINISSIPVISADIWKTHQDITKLTVVSPDAGGVVRARSLAKALGGANLAIVDKRREKINEAEIMNVIGNVKDCHCVLIDDIIDTAGTLCKSADALMGLGALSVKAYATHPVFSGPAFERIESSCLSEVVVTDTIPLKPDHPTKVRALPTAHLLSEVISRVTSSQSVSEIYVGQ